MDQDKINYYVDKIVNAFESPDGGISFKSSDEAFKELIENDKDFHDIFKKKRILAMENARTILEKMCNDRNVNYYHNKISPDSVFNVDEMFSICLSGKNHNEVIDLLRIEIDRSTNATLSLNEKTDLANCIFSAVIVSEIDSIDAAYQWNTSDCEIHRNLFVGDLENAVFKLSENTRFLCGYDGYIWKERSEYYIPNGIPGTSDFLCNCFPIPTHNDSKEHWEEEKITHQHKKSEYYQDIRDSQFKIKYLKNTDYVFKTDDEYEKFKKRIFDNCFTQYPSLSLITNYYRSKIYLENNDFTKLDSCIKEIIETNVSITTKRKTLKKILSLISKQNSLYEKYFKIISSIK